MQQTRPSQEYNFYRVLGIKTRNFRGKNAWQISSIVKKAYHEKLKQYHPDTITYKREYTKADFDDFSAVQNAYNNLYYKKTRVQHNNFLRKRAEIRNKKQQVSKQELVNRIASRLERMIFNTALNSAMKDILHEARHAYSRASENILKNFLGSNINYAYASKYKFR